MKMKIGSSVFDDVAIPVLWGTRAILTDAFDRISIIDLSGKSARLEVLGNEVAGGVRYSPLANGFRIFDTQGDPIYVFSPSERRLISETRALPDVQIAGEEIRIGTNVFRAISSRGVGVGMVIEEQGIAIGAPLPAGLADLVI